MSEKSRVDSYTTLVFTEGFFIYRRVVKKGRLRLLLIDNHHSYITIKFIKFYNQYFIIPFFFLPYITYFYQPLDKVAILKAELKKAGISRSNAEAKKNRRSILGTRGLVLAPTYANKKIVDRRTADSKKLERFQAKHAKKLEAEQQAQKARDLVEAEHEASMLARNPNHGNWYMDSQGGYL
ncbi:uncharacterized protein N7518_006137 [Penicillium psychrosexuale]|uniref:uncharacterized protein n=1 Tax=Penicillium psychrosexuale TaxID=1002107 RepID=UPI002544E44B|nr:uncharacterized protein N7518_006137 [Penicillium psychrosexuale]KAJ5789126.1 hypothetical protein N7518_006137 [Penicillium psychrosexuale]